MDLSNPESSLSEAKYINFPSLPADAKHPDGSPALNRYSHTITKDHDFPGARVGLNIKY
jgi:dihydroxy-acid dehydratase